MRTIETFYDLRGYPIHMCIKRYKIFHILMNIDVGYWKSYYDTNNFSRSYALAYCPNFTLKVQLKFPSKAFSDVSSIRRWLHFCVKSNRKITVHDYTEIQNAWRKLHGRKTTQCYNNILMFLPFFSRKRPCTNSE